MRRLDVRGVIDRRLLAWAYLLSFLLPPVGAFLWYQWRQDDPERAKHLGSIAIVGAVIEILFVLAISPTVVYILRINGMMPSDSSPKQVMTYGRWGTCPWHLDDEGTLIIEAGTAKRDSSSPPWRNLSDRIVGVQLGEGVVLPEDCSRLFAGLKEARGFYGSGADASRVTNMASMFWDSSFDVVDLGGWDVSGVESFSSMFHTCKSLQQIDVAGWSPSHAKDMSHMFGSCASLTSLDISDWDTSQAETMEQMFYGCESLRELDVSGWDVSSVQDMGEMFEGCKSLQELDVSSWNTSQVTSMSRMFFLCSNLASLDVSSWDVSNLENAWGLFSNCESLEHIDVSAWNTSATVNMNEVFNYCTSLRSVDLSGWDMSLADREFRTANMFRGCESLGAIAVGEKCVFSRWNTFPEPTSEDHPKQWYSQADHAWYGVGEILNRNGIADTYTNTEVAG